MAIRRFHQANCGDEQDRAEDIFNPAEARQQTDAKSDEKGPHDDCAADSPEQDAMLLVPAKVKRAKHDQEDEEIVDAQRAFDEVAGKELQRMLAPVHSQKPERKA